MSKSTLNDRQRGEAGHFGSGIMHSRDHTVYVTPHFWVRNPTAYTLKVTSLPH